MSFVSVALLHLSAAASLGFSVRLTDDRPLTLERWPTDHVVYRIALAGSDDLSPDESLAAVRAGFASWVAVSCATVTFEELGDAPDPHATLVNAGPDGHNDVVWIEDDAWLFGAYVLGVTVPLLDHDGHLAESDIAFNGYLVQWTTSGNGGTDLESVAVHEIGHFIGLQHNIGPYQTSAQPTMGPYVAGGIQNRTLEPDDERGACFLYPREPFVCLGDDDCPNLLSQRFESGDFYAGRLRCAREAGAASGSCTTLERFLPGLVGFGETCHRPEECAAGLACHPYGAFGMCTQGCDPFASDTCGADYRCEGGAPPLATAGVCVPLDGVVYAPGTGRDGCKSPVVCDAGTSCLALPGTSGADAPKRCVPFCHVADGDADCATGEGCWSYGAPTGACWDRALFPPEPEPDADPIVEPEPIVEPDDVAAVAEEAVATEASAPRDDSGCAGGGAAWWAALVALAGGSRSRTRARRKAEAPIRF